MKSRSGWRAGCVALVAVLASGLIAAGVGAPMPASAAATTVAGCTDANGVSVVVDLRQLGGGILERCAAGLGAGGTGLEALSRAGIPYQGTSQWGDAFICRLLGRPAADESLRIPGNDNYHEQCITTPPASAYWAYWYAPNGGAWHYSSAGASSHRVTPGGFEGWVFTLGDSSNQTPPGVAPVRASAAPSVPSAPGSSQATQPNDAGSQQFGGRLSAPARSSTTAVSQPISGAADSPTTSRAAAQPAQSNGAGGSPAGALVSTDIKAVGGRTSNSGAGISTGAILGACLLAFLLTIGGGTAWRQARARRQP